MSIPGEPAQKYDVKLRFKPAEVIWPDPTKDCRMTKYSLSGMSIFCVGEAVLRVNMPHVHGGQAIRFLMPSNPDFYREFELDDQYDGHMSELPELNLEAAEKMWLAYLSARSIAPEDAPGYVVECYGDSAELADELLHEVMYGTKRATSSLAKEYKQHGEPEPKAGDRWIVCDGSGEPRIIQRVVSVQRSSFFDVPAEFAAAEGEGDLSLEYWRRVHNEFWTRTQAELGCEWSPEQTTQPGEELLLERDEICWPPEFADSSSS